MSKVLQKLFKPRFNGVYSKDNFLKKMKDGAFAINKYADFGTHWLALYVKDNV